MYVLKSARMPNAIEAGPRGDGAAIAEQRNADDGLPSVIYLDPRPFTRDCVGGWLRRSLGAYSVHVLSDPDQIETLAIATDDIRATVINTGPERMASATAARLISRVAELLPDVPVAVLSDYEDAASVRQAFEHGVRGYIPTTLASPVAIGAVQLVCVGGTFAPATSLLSPDGNSQTSRREPVIEGFTQRQSQILDCLRRGMANKLIAYELSMCESTVKVHIRNIMKKLNATNRTQVAYLTRDLFEGQHQNA